MCYSPVEALIKYVANTSRQEGKNGKKNKTKKQECMCNFPNTKVSFFLLNVLVSPVYSYSFIQDTPVFFSFCEVNVNGGKIPVKVTSLGGWWQGEGMLFLAICFP